MDATKVSFCLDRYGKENLEYIGFTAITRIFPDRYKAVTFHQSAEIVEVISEDGTAGLWDYTDINVMGFKNIKGTYENLMTGMDEDMDPNLFTIPKDGKRPPTIITVI